MKIKGKGKRHKALYYYIQDGGKKVYLGEMSLFAAACKAQQLARKYMMADYRRDETEFVVASSELNITTTIVAIRRYSGSVEYINL